MDTWPRLDEHLVEDETREEMLHGRKVSASPAKPPHADQHSKLNYLLGAHLSAGYVASIHLLTRVSQDSEFAADTSVRRQGVDPETGTRYLEQLAFEVVSSQSVCDVSERAELLTARGVRRVFAIFVKRGQVSEWSVAEHRWVPLRMDGVIEDPALVRPLPVRGLIDARVADDAVAEALLAKRNPLLVEAVHTRARGKGREEGLVRGLTALCEALDIPMGPSERAIMSALDEAGLEALLDQIKTSRRWPAR